jgi:hypothetical protein
MESPSRSAMSVRLKPPAASIEAVRVAKQMERDVRVKASPLDGRHEAPAHIGLLAIRVPRIVGKTGWSSRENFEAQPMLQKLCPQVVRDEHAA